jgi:hypothetical protein
MHEGRETESENSGGASEPNKTENGFFGTHDLLQGEPLSPRET